VTAFAVLLVDDDDLPPDEAAELLMIRLRAYRVAKEGAHELRERLEIRNRCFLPGAKRRTRVGVESPQTRMPL
jgi:chromatin segregation and condensation protein Rec8/ScpA/Scc1 (kleisin family)